MSNSKAWPWVDAAIHEIGHTAFGLGDEYDYLTECVDANHSYTGPEPIESNVAKAIGRGTLKWRDLVLDKTPLPTRGNPNCAECDTTSPNLPAATVGAFEGAGYWHCALYRPAHECMMRSLAAFCSVCRWEILGTLAPYRPA